MSYMRILDQAMAEKVVWQDSVMRAFVDMKTAQSFNHFGWVIEWESLVKWLTQKSSTQSHSPALSLGYANYYARNNYLKLHLNFYHQWSPDHNHCIKGFSHILPLVLSPFCALPLNLNLLTLEPPANEIIFHLILPSPHLNQHFVIGANQHLQLFPTHWMYIHLSNLLSLKTTPSSV